MFQPKTTLNCPVYVENMLRQWDCNSFIIKIRKSFRIVDKLITERKINLKSYARPVRFWKGTDNVDWWTFKLCHGNRIKILRSANSTSSFTCFCKVLGWNFQYSCDFCWSETKRRSIMTRKSVVIFITFSSLVSATVSSVVSATLLNWETGA